jgi:hypothetical protein
MTHDRFGTLKRGKLTHPFNGRKTFDSKGGWRDLEARSHTVRMHIWVKLGHAPSGYLHGRSFFWGKWNKTDEVILNTPCLDG